MDYSVDRYGMRKALEHFSSSALKAIELAKPVIVENRGRIFVVALGFNAIGAKIAKLLNESIRVVQDYKIRSLKREDTLIIVSYSGNEEEVTSCHRDALRAGCETIIISSGGRILENALRQSQRVKLPHSLNERTALPYTIFSLLKILSDNQYINPGISLDQIARSIDSRILDASGQRLAEIIGDKKTTIYTTNGLTPAALSWKMTLNATAKEPCHVNIFPDLTNYELEGWGLHSQEHIIFLHEHREINRVLKQVEVVKKIVKSQGSTVSQLNIKDTGLKGLISTIVMGQYFAYYKALQKGIDPSPMNLTNEFKKQMGPFV